MKTTVSKEIYKFLLGYGDWCPSGHLEEQNFLNATGSTITRKARLLESEKWIAVRYVNGAAEYKALKTEAERNAYTPTVAPELDGEADELPEAPKYRFEPVLDAKGRTIAMRQIQV